MDKCREAFERHQANLTTTDYEALKAHFDSNEKYSGSRYNEGSLYERDWLVWEACWQSRQAEIDQLSTQNELLKKIAEDDMAKIERLESVINQNDAELKEKDKRIEACLKIVNDKFELAKSLAQGKTTPALSVMYETAKEMKCAVEEALRGERE